MSKLDSSHPQNYYILLFESVYIIQFLVYFTIGFLQETHSTLAKHVTFQNTSFGHVSAPYGSVCKAFVCVCRNEWLVIGLKAVRKCFAILERMLSGSLEIVERRGSVLCFKAKTGSVPAKQRTTQYVILLRSFQSCVSFPRK